MWNRLVSKVLLVVTVFVLTAASSVSAASVEMSKTTQAGFDKMVASADSSLASRISQQYQDLLMLQQQNDQWDEKLTVINKENAAQLSQFSKDLKQLDADKQARLENEYKQAKERYQPLFDSYTAVNKQITFARWLKGKEAVELLRAQAAALKIPVQLARQDIKNKLDAWNAAKKATSQVAAKVKQTIAETKPLQDQIKAKKKSITSLNSQVKTAWKPFSPAVKKGDTTATLSSLSGVVSLTRQKNVQKEGIYALEIGIRDILQRAKAQMK
ncbi:hypothetical protein ACFFK0_12450 [Paenibacillus chartarius]|uniref:Uncharacterized protein n=1 Tax=Paenibacillus chartarius TaxID=747481 RepID=A0ABV6DKS0_9BACL